MARNTANVSFYCRESKKIKDGLAPIEMSLIIKGKRCYRKIFTVRNVDSTGQIHLEETGIALFPGVDQYEVV